MNSTERKQVSRGRSDGRRETTDDRNLTGRCGRENLSCFENVKTIIFANGFQRTDCWSWNKAVLSVCSTLRSHTAPFFVSRLVCCLAAKTSQQLMGRSAETLLRADIDAADQWGHKEGEGGATAYRCFQRNSADERQSTALFPRCIRTHQVTRELPWRVALHLIKTPVHSTAPPGTPDITPICPSRLQFPWGSA